MGTQFLEEADDRTYRGVRAWLGALETDALLVFGLAGPMLETISGAIARSRRNPLLAELPALADALPREFWVRPDPAAIRTARAAGLVPGASLQVGRDYLNRLDRNAMTLSLSDDVVGFVPRDIAQLLAPDVDGGVRFTAEVIGAEGGGEVPDRVQVPLAGAGV
jgi:hypothetical protein